MSDTTTEKEVSRKAGVQIIQIRLGDSVELLRSMNEASVGAVICDPPYG